MVGCDNTDVSLLPSGSYPFPMETGVCVYVLTVSVYVLSVRSSGSTTAVLA